MGYLGIKVVEFGGWKVKTEKTRVLDVFSFLGKKWFFRLVYKVKDIFGKKWNWDMVPSIGVFSLSRGTR